MTASDLKLLWDIRVAAQNIRHFVADRSREQFTADVMMRSAVERQFEIIGEAAGRLRRENEPLSLSIPALAGAVAFRHFLIHVYDRVDLLKVWQIVQGDLPTLLDAIDDLMPRDQ